MVIGYSIGKQLVYSRFHSHLKRKRRHDHRIRELLTILARISERSLLHGRRIGWATRNDSLKTVMILFISFKTHFFLCLPINHQCIFKNKSAIEVQVCSLHIKWLQPTFSLLVRSIYCSQTSHQSGKAGNLHFQTIDPNKIKAKTSSIQAPTQNQKKKVNNRCRLILKISLNLTG